VSERTALVCAMLANNETGVVLPVREIAAVARNAGAAVFCDAVQAAGKIPADVRELPVDALALSAQKFGGPRGAGVLFVRGGVALQPVLGGHQERGRRAGTENLPGIVALGKAAEIAIEGLKNGEIERIRLLRDHIEKTVLAKVESVGVNSGGAPRVPNTVNIYFDFIEGEAMVIAMDLKGISVSTGAACSSGATEPSHVLTAIGLAPERARASIHFSLGKQNTSNDVDFALGLLPETVARLRELSPVYQGSVQGARS